MTLRAIVNHTFTFTIVSLFFLEVDSVNLIYLIPYIKSNNMHETYNYIAIDKMSNIYHVEDWLKVGSVSSINAALEITRVFI